MNLHSIQHVQNKKEWEDAFAVRKTVFVEEQQVPEEIEVDEHERDCEHVVLYSATGKPIAAGRFRPLSKEEAKMERICVLSDRRGEGLGTKIMQALEKLARQKGFSRLKLHAQEHATGFYEKLGYRVTSDPFLETGIRHVQMEKNL